jgi:hypothetical protein
MLLARIIDQMDTDRGIQKSKRQNLAMKTIDDQTVPTTPW